MSNKNKSNALSIALGTGFAVTLAANGLANAAENPFAATELNSGYMVAAHHGDGEGKCGEGKCGESKKDKEGKCGEGKCGDKKSEGNCGAKSEKEGKCGEGKCGS